MHIEFHNDWHHALFSHKGTFFESQKTGSIGRTTFGKNQELGVFTSRLNQILSISDLVKSLLSLFLGRAPWKVNGVNDVSKTAHERRLFETNIQGEGDSVILIKNLSVEPADVIAKHGGHFLDRFHCALVVWAKIMRVVNILFTVRCEDTGDKNEHIRVELIHDSDETLSASFFNGSL